MKHFFRVQTKGIEFSALLQHDSADGGSGHEGQPGVCACDSVTDLRNYISSWMIGDTADFEIVIFSGRKIGEVYDGLLTEPVEELARVGVDEFMADDSYCDYESW